MSVPQAQHHEVASALQMHQTGIGDLSAVKGERPEFGQPFQMLQTGVVQIRLVKPEAGEFGEPVQMLEPDFANLSGPEVKIQEVGQALEMLQPGTLDGSLVQVEDTRDCSGPSDARSPGVGDPRSGEIESPEFG